MLDIISHIPVYVFVIFVILLIIGLRRLSPREMGIGRLIGFLGLFLVLAIWGYFSQFRSPTVFDLSSALVGAGLGLFIGWHHVHRWKLAIDRQALSSSPAIP